MITSIVAAVVVFAILIVVHEAGHFFVAKRMGVRVLRFSIGYPPRIWGIRRGETDYAIGATPLGGYVRMLGDEISDQPSAATVENYVREIEQDLIGAAKTNGLLSRENRDQDDAIKAIVAEIASDGAISPERSRLILGREPKVEESIVIREIAACGTPKLARERLGENKPSALIEQFNARAFPTQPLRRRFAIVLAGPAANILFAPIVIALIFMLGAPITLPVIGDMQKDLPAYAAGLRSGDRVLSVNGTKVDSWDELSALVKSSGGSPIHFVIQRPEAGGKAATLDFTIRPKLVPETTIYGSKKPMWIIGVLPRGDERIRRDGPIDACKRAVIQTGNMIVALILGIYQIVSGATPVRQALGGPIMIAQVAGREAQQGLADLAMFAVMLSIELGIINLLPVPLLDGGHLLFFAIEGLRGKPLKVRHREIAMEVGLFLLFILMAFVIINDISRIIG